MDNAREILSRISGLSLNIPPDLISNLQSARSSSLPPKISSGKSSLQKAAFRLYNDNVTTIQSISDTISPHLHGPTSPAIIVALSVAIYSLASLILSVIQGLLFVAAAVVLIPLVLSVGMPPTPSSRTKSTTAAADLRIVLSGIVGILAASYLFSGVAATVAVVGGIYMLATQTATALQHGNRRKSHGAVEAHATGLRRASRYR